MNSIQFGAVRPSDVKEGAVFVTNQRRHSADDPRERHVAYVVTSTTGQVKFDPERYAEYEIITEGNSRRKSKSAPVIGVNYDTEQYEEQEDGSYLRTGASHSPYAFPGRTIETAEQTGLDLAEIDRQEGDRLWLKA